MDEKIKDLLRRLRGKDWQQLITMIIDKHTAQQDAILQHLQNIDCALAKLTGTVENKQAKYSKTCCQCHAPVMDNNFFCSIECVVEYLKPTADEPTSKKE